MNFESFLSSYQYKVVEAYPTKVKSSPLVSICVQTYQHVDYIKQCLDGILMQQTDFEFEILIGDDASEDGTREICIEYADKYPNKVKLFLHHRENNISIEGTPTGRFNFAYNLYMAKGKYIAICEGDDYWIDRSKLQKQVDFLENNKNYVLCAHNTTALKEDKKVQLNKSFEDGDFESVLLYGLNQDTLSVLFLNSFKELPSWFFQCPMGDYPLYLLLLEQGGKVKYLDEVMGVYRHHRGGMWSSMSKSKTGQRKIIALNLIDKGFNYSYNHLFKKAIEINKRKFGMYTYSLFHVLRGKTPLRYYIFQKKSQLKRILNAYTGNSI